MATGTSILIQFAGVGTTAVGHIRGGSTDRSLAVRLAFAGLATALVGISGAGIQTSALMLRCRIPAKIAVVTSTAAAAMTLAVGSVIVVTAGEVDWSVMVVAMPTAVLGALTARLLARSVPRGLGPAIGALMLAVAAGLTIAEISL